MKYSISMLCRACLVPIWAKIDHLDKKNFGSHWAHIGPIQGVSIPVLDQPLRNCQLNNIYFMVPLMFPKKTVFSSFDDEIFHFHALQGLPDDVQFSSAPFPNPILFNTWICCLCYSSYNRFDPGWSSWRVKLAWLSMYTVYRTHKGCGNANGISPSDKGCRNAGCLSVQQNKRTRFISIVSKPINIALILLLILRLKQKKLNKNLLSKKIWIQRKLWVCKSFLVKIFFA